LSSISSELAVADGRGRALTILKRLWVVAFLLGLIGLAIKLWTGERMAGYGSYVPWGLWVAIYFHGVGIAGGVFAAGVIGYIFRVPGLRENLRLILWISGVSLVAGLFAVWLDLGQPFRFYRIMTAPNFGSMMAFNAWLYNGFLGVLGLCFILSFFKRDERDLDDTFGWLVPLLLLGLLMVVMIPSQSGAFFGVVDAKPYWNSALMPIIFWISAMASGSAVLLFVMILLPGAVPAAARPPIPFLKWATLGSMVAYLFLEFAEFSIGYWGPTSHLRESLNLVLFGPFWWVFWIFHIGGALVAGFLLIRARGLLDLGAGAAIVAVTFISTRLNILIPGQAMAELKGLGEAFAHPRLTFHYTATPMEYLVGLFIAAFGAGLIYLGMLLLARHEEEMEVAER
jgi:molybdopterin-containing oxidoreductase family membrane subunit